MKRLCSYLVTVLLLAGVPSTAPAEIIVFYLQAEDFSNLSVTEPATAQVRSTYDYEGTFTGTFISQAFSLSDGRYLYLYQVDNQGSAILELVWVSPFYSPDLESGAGYLTGDPPEGCLAGGIIPPGQTYLTTLYKLSYQYPSYLIPKAHVGPGEHTVALYVISPASPTMGVGQVINSGTDSVEVPVAVPDPASVVLLTAGGGLSIWVRRRRRASR